MAKNLREEDRREVVEGHGVEPIIAIPLGSLGASAYHFTVPDGRIAGLAGIEDDGRVWMLCTPAILDFPLTFAREAKRFIESRTERVLWNYVDKRNTVHIKLLKFLGFTFLEEVPFGPNQLPFIRFENGTNHNASIGSAVVKGAGGIFGSIQGHNDQVAQARAKNQAMMEEYKHRLRSVTNNTKTPNRSTLLKLGQYKLGMKAADRSLHLVLMVLNSTINHNV